MLPASRGILALVQDGAKSLSEPDLKHILRKFQCFEASLQLKP